MNTSAPKGALTAYLNASGDLNQPTYTALSEDDAATMFANAIDKVKRMENFFEVLSRLTTKDPAIANVAIEGMSLSDSTIEDLRKSYRTMGLDGDIIE